MASLILPLLESSIEHSKVRLVEFLDSFKLNVSVFLSLGNNFPSTTNESNDNGFMTSNASALLGIQNSCVAELIQEFSRRHNSKPEQILMSHDPDVLVDLIRFFFVERISVLRVLCMIYRDSEDNESVNSNFLNEICSELALNSNLIEVVEHQIERDIFKLLDLTGGSRLNRVIVFFGLKWIKNAFDLVFLMGYRYSSFSYKFFATCLPLLYKLYLSYYPYKEVQSFLNEIIFTAGLCLLEKMNLESIGMNESTSFEWNSDDFEYVQSLNRWIQALGSGDLEFDGFFQLAWSIFLCQISCVDTFPESALFEMATEKIQGIECFKILLSKAFSNRCVEYLSTRVEKLICLKSLDLLGNNFVLRGMLKTLLKQYNINSIPQPESLIKLYGLILWKNDLLIEEFCDPRSEEQACLDFSLSLFPEFPDPLLGLLDSISASSFGSSFVLSYLSNLATVSVRYSVDKLLVNELNNDYYSTRSDYLVFDCLSIENCRGLVHPHPQFCDLIILDRKYSLWNVLNELVKHYNPKYEWCPRKVLKILSNTLKCHSVKELSCLNANSLLDSLYNASVTISTPISDASLCPFFRLLINTCDSISYESLLKFSQKFIDDSSFKRCLLTKNADSLTYFTEFCQNLVTLQIQFQLDNFNAVFEDVINLLFCVMKTYFSRASQANLPQVSFFKDLSKLISSLIEVEKSATLDSAWKYCLIAICPYILKYFKKTEHVIQDSSDLDLSLLCTLKSLESCLLNLGSNFSSSYTSNWDEIFESLSSMIGLYSLHTTLLIIEVSTVVLCSCCEFGVQLNLSKFPSQTSDIILDLLSSDILSIESGVIIYDFLTVASTIDHNFFKRIPSLGQEVVFKSCMRQESEVLIFDSILRLLATCFGRSEMLSVSILEAVVTKYLESDLCSDDQIGSPALSCFGSAINIVTSIGFCESPSSLNSLVTKVVENLPELSKICDLQACVSDDLKVTETTAVVDIFSKVALRKGKIAYISVIKAYSAISKLIISCVLWERKSIFSSSHGLRDILLWASPSNHELMATDAFVDLFCSILEFYLKFETEIGDLMLTDILRVSDYVILNSHRLKLSAFKLYSTFLAFLFRFKKGYDNLDGILAKIVFRLESSLADKDLDELSLKTMDDLCMLCDKFSFLKFPVGKLMDIILSTPGSSKASTCIEILKKLSCYKTYVRYLLDSRIDIWIADQRLMNYISSSGNEVGTMFLLDLMIISCNCIKHGSDAIVGLALDLIFQNEMLIPIILLNPEYLCVLLELSYLVIERVNLWEFEPQGFLSSLFEVLMKSLTTLCPAIQSALQMEAVKKRQFIKGAFFALQSISKLCEKSDNLFARETSLFKVLTELVYNLTLLLNDDKASLTQECLESAIVCTWRHHLILLGCMNMDTRLDVRNSFLTTLKLVNGRIDPSLFGVLEKSLKIK